MKNKHRHLFALCASIACAASVAVFIKGMQVAETSKQIQKAEAQVRGLFQPVEAPRIPEVSLYHYHVVPKDERAALFVAQIRN